MKEKTDKLDLIEIKNFCSSKDNFAKVNGNLQTRITEL